MGNLCTLLSSRNKVAPHTETIALMDRTSASQSATIASLEAQISSHEKLIAMHEATNVSLEAQISGYVSMLHARDATFQETLEMALKDLDKIRMRVEKNGVI